MRFAYRLLILTGLLAMLGSSSHAQTWKWLQNEPMLVNAAGGPCQPPVTTCNIPVGQFAPTTAGSIWVLAIQTTNNVTMQSVSGGGGTWIHCPNCHGTNASGFNVDAWYNLTGTAGTSQNISMTLSGSSGAVFGETFYEALPPAGSTASLDASGIATSVGCQTCATPSLTLTATDLVIINPGGASSHGFDSFPSPYITDWNGAGIGLNITPGTPTPSKTFKNASNNPAFFAIAFKSSLGNFTPPTKRYSLVNQSESSATCTNCSVTVPATGTGHLLYVQSASQNGAVIQSVSGGGSGWVVPSGAGTCKIAGAIFGVSSASSSCAYLLSSTAGSTSLSVTMSGSSAANLGVWEVASTTGKPFTLDTQNSFYISTTSAFYDNGPALTLAGDMDVVFQSAWIQGGSLGPTFYPLTNIPSNVIPSVGGGNYLMLNQFSISALFDVPIGAAPVPVWINPQHDSIFVSGIAFNSPSPQNITATDCNTAAVNAAIASANTGDTVLVPAGTCTWSGVNLNKAITVQGAGINSTNITLTGNNNVTKSAAGVQYIKGFSFSISGGGNANKGFTAAGSWRNAQPVVFQNNAFTTNGSALFLVTVPGGYIWANNTFNGAWDDSFLQIKDPQDPQGSWAFTDSIGTHDTNGTLNHYVESNTFTGGTNQGIDCDDGCRVVYRFNTLNYSDFNSHGEDTSAVGIRHFEVYNNSFLAPPPIPQCGGNNACLGNINQHVWIRGGTGVIYNNQFDSIAGSFWGTKSNIRMNIRGIEDVRPQGACGSVSYPAPHQLGQNNNGLNTVDPPYGSLGSGDFTDPIYFWGNTGTLLTSFGFNWGNPCGFTFSTFFQTGRDVVNPGVSGGSPKPGYTAFTYPHPLVAPITGPALNIYLAQASAGAADGSVSCANARAASYFNSAANWGTGLTQIGSGTTIHLCGSISIVWTPPTSQGTGKITLKYEPGAKLSAPANQNFIIFGPSTNKWKLDGGTLCGPQPSGGNIDVPCNGVIENTANGTNLANQVYPVVAIDHSLVTGDVEVVGVDIRNLYVHTAPITLTNITSNGSTTVTATCATPCGFSAGQPLVTIQDSTVAAQNITTTTTGGFTQVGGATVASVSGTNITFTYPSPVSAGTSLVGSLTENAIHNSSVNCTFANSGQFLGNFTIHDGICQEASWGLDEGCSTGAAVTFEAYHMDLFHTDHGIAIGGNNSDQSCTFKFHDNRWRDPTNWNTGTVNSYHHDGGHIFNNALSAAAIKFWNNKWEGPFTGNGTAFIFPQSCPVNFTEYNDVFVLDAASTGQPPAMWFTGSGANQTLWNNSFIENGQPAGSNTATIFVQKQAGCVTGTNNTFLNNLSVNGTTLMSSAGTTYAANTPSTGLDYNFYGGYVANGNKAFNWNSTTTTNLLSAWQTASGEGVHSLQSTTGQVDASGVPVSGSGAIASGSNICASIACVGDLAALAFDTSAGNTRVPVLRPASSAWDMGAFQVGGAPPAPVATLSTSAVNFLNQIVNSTSSIPQLVTLTNTGGATLTISSIVISGANPLDFAQSNNCGTSLSAGTLCTISLTFSPTVTSTRSATVSITDNASGSPHTISLIGYGFKLITGVGSVKGNATLTVGP